MFYFIIGTRPEYIKLRPIWEKMPEGSYVLFFTNQQVLPERDKYPDAAILFSPPIKSLSDSFASILTQLSIRFSQPFNTISGVVVQGDTTSAAAGALAAFQNHLPVYHVEAGLRTYDLDAPYPEEGYRRMITQLAYKHFCPTEDNADSVYAERHGAISHTNCIVTGNTILDTLPPRETAVDGTHVMVTMHRRENFPKMREWLETIEVLAADNPSLTFLLIKHSNTQVSIHYHHLPHVNIIDALDHSNFTEHLRNCHSIITDSGGIQEEACWFNKRCYVCRTSTERSEGIESGHLTLCPTPNDLLDVFDSSPLPIDAPCPFGDGKASERIAAILKNDLLT
jgi:UDP-N-acetylglucosamine 2-epimerase (non-hydrolysing)